jgi:hypothetical protein
MIPSVLFEERSFSPLWDVCNMNKKALMIAVLAATGLMAFKSSASVAASVDRVGDSASVLA